MVFNCLRFAVVLLISFFVVSALRSQEAVDVERSPTPAPESTPEKSTKKETASEKPTKGVEEAMRPEEFKSAGLDKLSEDELQHLDAWLQGYRHTTEKKASEQAQAKAGEEIKKANEEVKKANEKAERSSSIQKLDSLVSRVDGDFHGLT